MTTQPQTQPVLVFTSGSGAQHELVLPLAAWRATDTIVNWDERFWVLAVEAVSWPIPLPGLETLGPMETFRLHVFSFDASGTCTHQEVVRSMGDTRGWQSLEVTDEVLELARQLLAEFECARTRRGH